MRNFIARYQSIDELTRAIHMVAVSEGREEPTRPQCTLSSTYRYGALWSYSPPIPQGLLQLLCSVLSCQALSTVFRGIHVPGPLTTTVLCEPGTMAHLVGETEVGGLS